MNQISCFIVEDDPQALAYATAILDDLKVIRIIGNSGYVREAADQIKSQKPDVIILDVFLEDGTAFDFLKLFDNIDFRIVFTTSFADHAIDAFRFSAIDYLLKPYEPFSLIAAIEKVKQNITASIKEIQLQTLLSNISKPKQPKKIVLKNFDAINVVDIATILYAKSDNNYTTFFINNRKEILVSGSLKSFEEKLSGQNFFRVHQSYLINLDYVSSFQKGEEMVVLNTAIRIPVAQSRKQELLRYIDML